MTASQFSLEVQPRIPRSLERLPELANNLVYSWDRDLRRLFRYIDNELYERCGSNLKLFLRRVSQERIDRAAEDPTFIRNYNQVLSVFDTYQTRRLPADLREYLDPETDLVAYFCFEFGFHDSLPLYSGGLGILAADHCKAAADLAVPLVAVGLMYHQGYYVQHLDSHGGQIERYHTTQFDTLPLAIVRDENGEDLKVTAPAQDAEIALRIWHGCIGNVSIYLLDSDLPENPDAFRSTTHRLYGGDICTRIRQELVLGVGGVRALRALGLHPTAWHLNEGHSAFQCLERCRELMVAGYSFDTALEVVAGSTVFTTHTPVPAGHDVFDAALVEQELGGFLEALDLDLGHLLELGLNDEPGRLNMTALALRGSRFHNGVSRIHGEVAARSSIYAWPEIPHAENPMTHITNGVHLQTFLALEWLNLFDMRFSDWRSNLSNPAYWDCIDEISDHQFRSLRRDLKSLLLSNARQRLLRQHRRNGLAETTIERLLEPIDDPHGDVLVLGFARRFATYKRATLIFSDRERLARLLNDPKRPVLLFMAGKAHPEDEPGKQLIRRIYELSMTDEFIGKIHLIENYDLALGRMLVAGVDVWLNTPEYPLEASGTSGMKAAMNGAVNLSVLDGWWAEAFDGRNGWSIKPHDHSWDYDYRQHQEAEDLLEILEHKVIPLYFNRRESGGWVDIAKRSMKSTIPHFNAERMLRNYITQLYGPAVQQYRALSAENAAAADTLQAWKQRVAQCWNGVSATTQQLPQSRVAHGETVTIAIEILLNGLAASDVRAECLITPDNADIEIGMAPLPERTHIIEAEAEAGSATDVGCYSVRFEPPFPGLQHYRIRIYPHHPLLAHRFEMGRMIWL